MTLRLYDTAARAVRDFVPLEEGRVGIYVCGLTVQSEPHVGHVRSAVNFDVLRRWLVASGYDVTFIRNITDIDDKILIKAAEQGRAWYNLAYDMKRELDKAYDALHVLPPTYEPAATGHVPEMLELIALLVERGHAYAAEDGSGDVYFDVQSWPSYGELTRQKVDDMEAAEDADPRGKRDPRDFALWKGHKESEPETASWAAPWGRGRPGWHIECSAMAEKYLGPSFDIHGGGVDLRFPHHENEQAQSRAAGHPFASYWMHNAWITTSGEKMSKSLGNSLLVPSVLERVRGIELRYYMVAAHYRSTVEFSFEALEEAALGFQRIEGFLRARGLRPCRGRARASRDLPDAFSPRWTTTSELRLRWACSTTPCARATRRWPTAIARRPRPMLQRSKRCSACSVWTPPTRTGPTRQRAERPDAGRGRPGQGAAGAARRGARQQGLRHR